MENEKQFLGRSNLLLGVFFLCLLVFSFILYDAQVVDYETHLARSTTQVTTTETVEASRGIVTDRNGKVLISNREIYVVNFDPDAVTPAGDETKELAVSRALLRLIRQCQALGVKWTDTLPISSGDTGSYYTLTGVTDVVRARFQSYLLKHKWIDTELSDASPLPAMSAALKLELGSRTDALTAPVLLSLMEEDLGIDESFSTEEKRLVLGVLYELELRKKEITYSTYTFAEDVSVELISILTDGRFQGITVEKRSVRQYNTEYAAHILGRIGSIDSKEERAALNEAYNAAKEAGKDTTGLHYYYADDLVGKSGVESAFESYLRGIDGKRLITTNEEGKITSELYSTEPQPGATLALTIDIDFQGEVERALKDAVEAMNAEDEKNGVENVGTRGAAAVVLSIADSDILAMASYPTYIPSDYYSSYSAYAEDIGMPFFNRALHGTYAPGSTFKLCTSVAALESGIITPNTRINATGLYTYYDDYQPACWIYNMYRGAHGRINVSEAILHSCNYFYYEVGRLMGINTLNHYAALFGLGQPTGVELSEKVGILDGPEYRAQSGETWVGGTVLQCAIGQGSSLFTPLQLASYTATVVRGGDRYAAHLLDNVTLFDGSIAVSHTETELLSSVGMAASTLSAVKRGMGDLVELGSIAPYFDQCVVTAGAKTGSAQTGGEVANGVFVCFAPFDDPEIAVAIVIEEGGSGSALAATAVNILNAYFAPGDIGTALIPEGSLLP